VKIEWKKSLNWYGPGAYLFYEIDLENKLQIDIMCKFSDDDKVVSYRSEIRVTINKELNYSHIYDDNLEVAKLKSLIKAKELGFDIDKIITK